VQVVSLSYIEHIAALISLGVFTGLLSGLLGIGGGVVIVPALLVIFHLMGLDPSHLMQYAVGTSLGVMVVNATSATSFHLKHEKPNWLLLLKIIPCVCVGVLFGTTLAHFLSTAWLKRIFAVLLLFISYKMISGKRNQEGQVKQDNLTILGSSTLGTIVGFCSGLLGIGGGVITVPFLLHKQFSYRHAVIISLLMSLAGALTGVILYMIIGMLHAHAVPTPKGFVGDVYVIGAVLVAIGAIPGTYLASKIMPYCSVIWLKRIFAILLLLTAAHLLI
jgi:uncharacterized membrane protein YfcA